MVASVLAEMAIWGVSASVSNELPPPGSSLGRPACLALWLELVGDSCPEMPHQIELFAAHPVGLGDCPSRTGGSDFWGALQRAMDRRVRAAETLPPATDHALGLPQPSTVAVDCWNPARQAWGKSCSVLAPRVRRWQLEFQEENFNSAGTANLCDEKKNQKCDQIIFKYESGSGTQTAIDSRWRDWLSARLNPVTCRNLTDLKAQWQRSVSQADRVILIAPQPEMATWLALVRDWQSRVVCCPVEILERLENKVSFAGDSAASGRPGDSPPVPCGVSPSLPGRLMTSRHSSADLPADSELQDWYHHALATHKVWAVKPTDQCGGCDVWKVTLRAAITHWRDGWDWVQKLRRELSKETSDTHPILWSAWHNGVPCSLSMIANRDGWWCLPPCRQILQLEALELPAACRSIFETVERVRYVGTEWIDPGAPGWLNSEQRDQLLLKQFAHRLPADRWGDLRGWIGLDYVWDQREGPRLIEVNPRLTSSFNLLTHLEFETAPD